MRPLKLVLNAFGSYTGRVEVDLEKLGREGLYLICGDTGAGKSTLFDGICFALYGQTSGAARRDGEVLRSELAPPQTQSYVELTFEHGGKRYGLWRSLKYQRPALRGEGLIQQDSNAALTLPDGSVVEGKRRVNEKVEEILRLKYEHFSRIMMIAQGEFNQLLMADTEARGRILQKICDTSRHRALQDRLQEEARALEEKRRPLEEQVKGAFAYAECGPDSPSAPALEALKGQPSVYRGQELAGLVEQIQREDQAALEAQKEREDQARAGMEGLLAVLAQFDTLTQARQSLEAAQAALAREAERLPGLVQARDGLLADKERAAALEAQAAALEERMSDYQAMEKDRQTLAELTAQGEALKGEIAQAQAGAQAQRQALAALQREMAALAAAPEALAQAQARVQALLEQGKAARQLSLQAQELGRQEGALAQDQARLTQLAAQAREKGERVAQLRQQLLLHQAGILAAGLREGQPCPVCGSTRHPSPAPLSSQAPTEEGVRQAEEQAQQAQDQAQALAGQVRQALGRVQAQRDQLERALAEQGAKAPSGASPQALAQLAQGLRQGLLERYQRENRDLEQKQGQARRLEQLSQEQPLRQKELERQESALQQARDRAARGEGSQAALTKAIAARRQALAFDHPAQAQAKIDALRRGAAEHRQALEGAEQAVQACQEEIRARQSAKALLEEQIEKRREAVKGQEEQAVRQALAQAQAALRDSGAQRAALAGRMERNRICVRQVRQALTSFAALEARCVLARSLADTAMGRLRGRDKLTFERYVQVDYFERVLAMANQRFLQMTSGQYQLERAQEAENLRAQAGLELNVLNHFTGARRSVKSLSGGESFMASLALALGFADVIRQQAGGVVMDALFIDEGFGALDEAALDQVITALTRLCGGGKLIGIISHVPQLRERIERQVVVRKGCGGSQVQLLC